MEAMIKVVIGLEVYLSRTIKPLNIQNLYVERVVKRVRRYAVEVDDGFELVNEFGVFCVLKQSRFRDVRYLPCWFWKDCHCGNVKCWEKIKPLIEDFRRKLAERGVGFDG